MKLNRPFLAFAENDEQKQTCIDVALINLGLISEDNSRGLPSDAPGHRSHFAAGFLDFESPEERLRSKGALCAEPFAEMGQYAKLGLLALCAENGSGERLCELLTGGAVAEASAGQTHPFQDDTECQALARQILNETGLGMLAISPDYSKAKALAAMSSMLDCARRIGQLTGLGTECIGACVRSLEIEVYHEQYDHRLLFVKPQRHSPRRRRALCPERPGSRSACRRDHLRGQLCP